MITQSVAVSRMIRPRATVPGSTQSTAVSTQWNGHLLPSRSGSSPDDPFLRILALATLPIPPTGESPMPFSMDQTVTSTITSPATASSSTQPSAATSLAAHGLQLAGAQASLVSLAAVYVGSNPSVFKNAYWEFNYVKVFQAQAVSTTSSSTHTTTRSRGFMPESSTFMPTSSSMPNDPYRNLTTTISSTTSWSTDSTQLQLATTGTVHVGWPVSTLIAPAMGGGVDVNRAGPFGLDGYAWGPTTTATATATGDDGQVYTTVLTSKFIPTRSLAFLILTSQQKHGSMSAKPATLLRPPPSRPPTPAARRPQLLQYP